MDEESSESHQSGFSRSRLEGSNDPEDSSGAYSAPEEGAHWNPQDDQNQAANHAANHAVPLGAAMGSAQTRSGRWAVSQRTRSVAAAPPRTPMPDPGFQSILRQVLRQAPQGNTNALVQQLSSQAEQVSRRASENAARRRAGGADLGGGAGVGPGAALRGDRGIRSGVAGGSRVRPAEVPAQVLRGPATRPRYIEPSAVLITSRDPSQGLMPPPPPVPGTPAGQRIPLPAQPRGPLVPHLRPAAPASNQAPGASQSYAQPDSFSAAAAGPSDRSSRPLDRGRQHFPEVILQRQPSEESGNPRFAPSPPSSTISPRILFPTRNPLEIAEQNGRAGGATSGARSVRIPRPQTSSKSHMRFRIRSQFTLDPRAERDRYPQSPWGDRGPNHKAQLKEAYTSFTRVLTRKYNREMDRKHPRMRTIPITEATNEVPGITYDTLQNEYLEWTWIFHDVVNQERE